MKILFVTVFLSILSFNSYSKCERSKGENYRLYDCGSTFSLTIGSEKTGYCTANYKQGELEARCDDGTQYIGDRSLKCTLHGFTKSAIIECDTLTLGFFKDSTGSFSLGRLGGEIEPCGPMYGDSEVLKVDQQGRVIRNVNNGGLGDIEQVVPGVLYETGDENKCEYEFDKNMNLIRA